MNTITLEAGGDTPRISESEFDKKSQGVLLLGEIVHFY